MKVSEVRRLLTRCGFYVVKDGSLHEIWTDGKERLSISHGSKHGLALTLRTRLEHIERDYRERQAQERARRYAHHVRHITSGEAKPGSCVKCLHDFEDVPAGTTGLINEDYGSGIVVKWDLPHRSIPIRDAFAKANELVFLGPA